MYFPKARWNHYSRMLKHAENPAEFLPAECISLAYPGFKAEKETIAALNKKMDQLAPDQSDTVVLDLLSNTACMETVAVGPTEHQIWHHRIFYNVHLCAGCRAMIGNGAKSHWIYLNVCCIP